MVKIIFLEKPKLKVTKNGVSVITQRSGHLQKENGGVGKEFCRQPCIRSEGSKTGLFYKVSYAMRRLWYFEN